MINYLKISILLLGLLLLNSCSVLERVHPTMKLKERPALGVLVMKSLDNVKESKGFPKVAQPLSVQVQKREFTNRTFKKLENTIGASQLGIKYVDSLPEKPSYFTIDLTDDIAYISTLKSEANKSIYAFAKANHKSRVVSQISIVFKNNNLDPDHTYFVAMEDTGCQLIGVGKDGKKKSIRMEEGIIFDNELSYFAWGESAFGKSELADIVEEGVPCPSNLERKPSKLYKEKSLFKY